MRAFRIDGNTQFDSATLHALVATAEGSTLTLAELNEVADRITRFYRLQGHGYTLALIPAQAVDDGLVRIQVVEARYGRITLENKSQVDDRLLQALSAGLIPGQPVLQAQLDRVLLLLSDLPGLKVRGTLSPGERLGEAALTIVVEAGRRWAGQVTVDNFGSPLTGTTRLGTEAQLSHPLNRGDRLSLAALTAGRDLNQIKLGYDIPRGSTGDRVGGGVSALRYGLGGLLTDLGASGSSLRSELFLSRPLVRGAEANLSARLRAEALRVHERIEAGSLRSDRRILSLGLELQGDAGNIATSRLLTSWQTTLQHGRVRIEDPLALDSDTATARTQGSFWRWNASGLLQYALDAQNSLNLSLAAQAASKNLDPSQKLALGGTGSLRAFPGGVVSIDQGQSFQLEYRRRWGEQETGRLTSMLFWDVGRGRLNHRPWTPGVQRVTLQGAGLGVVWSSHQAWQLRLLLARPTGRSTAALAADRSSRSWADLSYSF